MTPEVKDAKRTSGGQAVPEKTRVSKAKFENGFWSYLKETGGANGRASKRWMPEHHFDGSEAVHLGKLRATFLAQLPAEEAAMIAIIQAMNDFDQG